MPVALLACGGGDKKSSTTPKAGKGTGKASATKETEEDRANKRHAAALAIVPDGSTCLPAVLKEPGAPRLDLAAVGMDSIVCASDTDKSRLLGPIACWKVNLENGKLTYQVAAPLAGRGIDVRVDDRCARVLPAKRRQG